MIRNFIDYHKYVFRLKMKETLMMYVDLIVFISSLFVVFGEWVEIAKNITISRFFILILLGSFIKFLYDSYLMMNSIKAFLDLRYGELNHEDIDLSKYTRSQYDLDQKFEIIQCNSKLDNYGYVLTSPTIDKYISKTDLMFERNKKMEKKIRRFIKSDKDNLMFFLKYQYRHAKFYGKGFFNEKKFCLSNDLMVNQNTIECHKGTYYDTYLTNIICGKEIKSNQNDKTLADAVEYFPSKEINDDEYSLFDITSSCMNNEIGISTIGITKDNHLVLWTQNRSAQSSSGLLVPTGSGSCDWKDRRNSSFTQTIIHAMKRELWEESGKTTLSKSYEDVGQTKIIGYFRWMIKGGKPEFVGLTKMNANLVDLEANLREVYGRHFRTLTPDNIESELASLMQNNNISVPLYMNIHCLQNAIKENFDEVYEFIFTSKE